MVVLRAGETVDQRVERMVELLAAPLAAYLAHRMAGSWVEHLANSLVVLKADLLDHLMVEKLAE